MPGILTAPDPTPKLLMTDKQEALLQMQKTDPFCKRIAKQLSNGIAPKHKTYIFTQVRGLLYKHVTSSGPKFLALVIPKSWRYTVLVEVHDKLGHQGNTCTYCLIKCQYHWKGMNKDIRKYITNCALCHREKAKVQAYPLQMTEIPDRPFDKIAINLVTECETSTSGNKLCEKDLSNWDKYLNQVLASYRVMSNLGTAETPFFLVYGRDPNLPLHQLLE